MLSQLYPWIKAFHIISVIAWMAGMLYLPRLFVYHCEAPAGTAQSETFKVMEHRLLNAIMTPAMIASLVFGVALMGTPGIVDWSRGWIWVKLAAVLALLGLHACFAQWKRAFAADRNPHGRRFYRVANEAPTLLMIAIVIMAVVKPL